MDESIPSKTRFWSLKRPVRQHESYTPCPYEVAHQCVLLLSKYIYIFKLSVTLNYCNTTTAVTYLLSQTSRVEANAAEAWVGDLAG